MCMKSVVAKKKKPAPCDTTDVSISDQQKSDQILIFFSQSDALMCFMP